MGELVVVHIKTFIPTFQCMSFHEIWIWIDIGTFYVNFWNSSRLPIQHILEVNLKFESDEKSKFYTATQVVLPIRCVLHVFFIIIFFYVRDVCHCHFYIFEFLINDLMDIKWYHISVFSDMYFYFYTFYVLSCSSI